MLLLERLRPLAAEMLTGDSKMDPVCRDIPKARWHYR